MMKITYIGHSGFFVEMEDACFLFDYYKGTIPETDGNKKMYVFVSHRHHDHYNEEIFRLQEKFRDIQYIISSDVYELASHPEKNDKIIYMKAGEEADIKGCYVRTLRSNDEGTAFFIRYKDQTIYHAGDLNWWHWEGEPDEYNKNMRRSYQSEINKLCGEKIDAAFVPVDPRLGEQYCLGIDCFMKRTETKRVFPMHFWGNYDVCSRLMLEECTKDYQDKIVKIEKGRTDISMQVKIYTDGAARGNPDGPGGYGAILEYVDTKGTLHTKELSRGYVRTTNNRMELMAVIAGLEALNRPCEVEVYSDSQYVVNAFNKQWVDGWIKKGWKRGKNEPVKNPDLWKRLLKAKEKHKVSFHWVKGHDGHPQNERCDLACHFGSGWRYTFC